MVYLNFKPCAHGIFEWQKVVSSKEFRVAGNSISFPGLSSTERLWVTVPYFFSVVFSKMAMAGVRLKRTSL